MAPYLSKGGGTYYVALNAPGDAEEDQGVKRWRAKMAAQKDRLGTVHETMLGPDHLDIAPPGSADLVLTFRNLHNWMDGGFADKALAACFTALKPGGILGIEEHRGSSDKPQDPKAKDGYVRQDFTVALAKKAGFVLVGSSEINANPKDTKDWVDGVWTLPPTLSQKDKDRARYLAVGEAGQFRTEVSETQALDLGADDDGRAVTESRGAKWGGIYRGRIVGGEFRGELPCPGANAESMPGKIRPRRSVRGDRRSC